MNADLALGGHMVLSQESNLRGCPMQVTHVGWDGSEYRVVRVANEQPQESFCNSPEELGLILRESGVAQEAVNLIFKQLEVPRMRR